MLSCRDEDNLCCSSPEKTSSREHRRRAQQEEEAPEDLLFLPQAGEVTVGFRSLDEFNLEEVFEVRALVMRSIPKFLRGVFRGALKVSPQEILRGQQRNDRVAESRGWKLFLLPLRILLFRPPRGGLLPKGRLREGVDRCSQGDWVTLVQMSLESSLQGMTASCRRPSGHPSREGQQEHLGWPGWENCPSCTKERENMGCSY